jgi:hypothetical protein
MHNNLGAAYLKTNPVRGGRGGFQRAIEIDPGISSRTGLGLLFTAFGRRDGSSRASPGADGRPDHLPSGANSAGRWRAESGNAPSGAA